MKNTYVCRLDFVADTLIYILVQDDSVLLITRDYCCVPATITDPKELPWVDDAS